MHEDDQELQRLRRAQRTSRFQRRYRKRVVAEHAIALMVRRGLRQACYFGRAKTACQVALIATVVNLSLVARATAPSLPFKALGYARNALTLVRPLSSWGSQLIRIEPGPRLGMPTSCPGYPRPGRRSSRARSRSSRKRS